MDQVMDKPRKSSSPSALCCAAVVTNVAGPRSGLCLAGVPLDGFVFWVPTSGPIGVGASIVSYRDRITLALVVDDAVVPDCDRMLCALED